ncbi:carbohydrate ABC transporter membrane protein 1 (CUT1 family) [Paenibacillus cellulosilyticus]|uniref:Carbohydrate ABC transporter membrane protein 1 (CUT1 family) n=1 Tax=Paenibacillus cellulosilyticus TaxID=375489 RepID=A0A2V2YQN3_9BACL|nr:carbohydrate ABC transporter membrane protein 1 (CUT1 family) [Paenibacillus cellulosilyticus]
MYLLFLPVLIYFVIFHYWPMYGLQIAFKEYSAIRGIGGSPWTGWTHFERFYQSSQFWIIIKNTVLINVYELLVAFPIPILFALLLNQIGNERFKKTVQTITYAPHFISIVVVVGMLHIFLSPRTGMLNHLLVLFGAEPVFFMGSEGWFKSIFVFSGVWQNMGWSSIVYVAALSGVNPDMHEAAVMDGASKLQRIMRIDLPSIQPIIVILLIMNIGSFMSVGFEKIYLMQNALNLDASEVIQTYVYKTGLLGAQFSYSTAIGLVNAVINFMLLAAVNQVAKKYKQTSLW